MINTVKINIKERAKFLGVIIDEHLSFHLSWFGDFVQMQTLLQLRNDAYII